MVRSPRSREEVGQWVLEHSAFGLSFVMSQNLMNVRIPTVPDYKEGTALTSDEEK